MKFGRGYAEWDAEAYTEGELDHVLKSFCLVNKHASFHTAVIWCDYRQLAMVEKALEGAAYSSIQPIFWYKYEQNQQMAAHLRVSAVETGLIAFHGTVTAFSSVINVPMDLYDRHNIVIVAKVCQSTPARNHHTSLSTSGSTTASPIPMLWFLALEQEATCKA